MLCSKCAEFLPDDARFCLQCGQAVDQARTATVSAARPASKARTQNSPRPRRQSGTAIWVFLLVIIVATWWVVTSNNITAQQVRELASGAHTEAITEKAFSVNSHSFSPYKFSVPPGAVNVFVSGQFSASGTPGNDVQVYVLTDDAFVTWRNGYAISPYYDSGKVSQGSIHAALPVGAGTYYLVFNNNFSLKTAKAIQADVTLHYNTWWPDWLFHLNDKLWGN